MAIDFRFIKKETIRGIAEAVKNYLTRDGEDISIANVPTLIENNFNKDLRNIVEADGRGPMQYVFLEETQLKGVTKIGAHALKGWSYLKTLGLPNSVTDIGYGACSGATTLETVRIGNGVTNIGEQAFYGCSDLKNLTIGRDVSIIGESAFKGCSALESVVLPGRVTYIGDYIFSGCTNLSNITLGTMIKTIGKKAFENCKSLTDTNFITSSITDIGEYAFYKCENLLSADTRNATSLGKGVFANCTSLESVNINECSEIPPFAFIDCTSLAEVYTEKEQCNIGEAAFKDCEHLSSSFVRDILLKTLNIGNYAFSNATDADIINIPGTVATIGGYAFSDNQNLASILFSSDKEGSKLESIGSHAFANCSQLSSIIFLGSTSVPQYLGNLKDEITSICRIHVPYSLYDEWITAPNWCDIADRIGIIQSTIPTEEEETDV